jgi:hypothetical protein
MEKRGEIIQTANTIRTTDVTASTAQSGIGRVRRGGFGARGVVSDDVVAASMIGCEGGSA